MKSRPKTTCRISSSWETIDSQHPKSQSSPRKKSSQPKRKGASIGISPVPTPIPVSRNYDCNALVAILLFLVVGHILFEFINDYVNMWCVYLFIIIYVK